MVKFKCTDGHMIEIHAHQVAAITPVRRDIWRWSSRRGSYLDTAQEPPGAGPAASVRLRDGTTLLVQGRAGALLEQLQEAMEHAPG